VAPRDSRIFAAQAFAFSRGNARAVLDLLGRSQPDGGGNTGFNSAPLSGERGRAWVEVSASTVSADGQGASPGFRGDAGGLSGGVDGDLGRGARLGLALAYDRDKLHDDAGGAAAASIFRVSLYGSQVVGPLGFSEAFSYARASNHTHRATGAGDGSASYDSEAVTGAVQVAAPFRSGPLALTPLAGVLVSNLASGALAERDAVSTAFAVTGVARGATWASPYVTLGLSREFAGAGGLVITPDLLVGYRHDPDSAGQAFSLKAADGTAFEVKPAGLGGGSAVFGASVTAHARSWTAYAKVRAQVAGKWSDESATVGFRLAF
jgi:uncharacterized protein with beta-barrel porin domain